MMHTGVDWNEELERAIGEEDAGQVRLALEHGADPNRRRDDGLAFAGTTPLYDAVLAENADMVRLLIAHGAKVAAEAPELGSTSLHEAAEEGRPDILALLLQTDVGPHLGTFDYINRAPLHWSAARGDAESARLLLGAGADVNARNEDHAGDSALHVAVEAGHAEMVALLLEYGAEPLAEGWMWRTPLSESAGVREPDRIRIREMLEAAVAKRSRNDTFRHDAGRPRRKR